MSYTLAAKFSPIKLLLRSNKQLGKAPNKPNPTVQQFCDGNCQNPKTAKNSFQLDLPDFCSDPDQPSDLIPESEDSDQESIIFDLFDQTLELTETPKSQMDVEALQQLLSDNIKEQAAQWQQQITALTENLQKAHATPKFSTTHSMIPKFSGAESEDVTEFLANFNRAARFYQFTNERKAEALPLYLTGNANIWFNTTPGLNHKTFDELAEALKAQFHSASDVWLLRQKLYDRKQLPTETVAEFAAAIRRLCQRIALPRPECLTLFIQNLRPELKNHVLLQRPASFEEAEMHAKMKESLPDPKQVDRTDEILHALAKLNKPPSPTPIVAAYAPPNADQRTHPPQGNHSLTRDDITQIVRQEMRRANTRLNPPTQRGRRTFDGRPICDFCSKPGHVLAVCRQRLNQRRDPRIPQADRLPRPPQSWNRPQYNQAPRDSQPLN